MGRTKTSIYIDGELWERFKKYARNRGTVASRLLEEILRERIGEGELAEVLDEMLEEELAEIDFEPIRPRGGSVSSLVRELRDERANSIPRQ